MYSARHEDMVRLPELLAPAGDFEKLKTAFHFGADAVYTGLSAFSLRAKAENFDLNGLKDAVEFVHDRGGKIYVTINIFPHNRDIGPIREHLQFLNEVRPDALIISDPGIMALARKMAPDMPVHVSTQANITNTEAARFWQDMGAKRIVLSRELSISEIEEIRNAVTIELECFVHGALCISYSGRCYISSFLANRSGNRGECTNSCRWRYALTEEKRPGEYYPVYENDRGTFIMSSRDLCMIEHLDKLAAAGVDSFKIEGRMKGINYVAGVVKVYREAVDRLKNGDYSVDKRWLAELSMFSSRGFTTGMYLGSHPQDGYNHDEEEVYRASHELVGTVVSSESNRAVVALRNRLRTGDMLEFLSPRLPVRTSVADMILDTDGNPLSSACNEDIVIIPAPEGTGENDIVRRKLMMDGKCS
jgi:putative protease